MADGDFGVVHAELFQVGHLHDGVEEHLSREPVDMASIESDD